MGRAPCCDKTKVKKGPWSPEEDAKLNEYIEKNGTGGNWIALPQKAGLKRCGKSCRLRWLNYLRPNIKHGDFTDDEDMIICSLFSSLGTRWSIIAAQLPGRTDNDIKNYWNTKLKKKFMGLFNQQSQTKPHPAPASFSSLLQTSSSSSSSSTPVSYNFSNNSTYYNTTTCFTGLELNSSISNNLMLSSNSCITAAPNLRNMQHHQVKENVSMFGGDQASCSSSDGSCSNQISTVKEIDYGYAQMGVQNSCFYNGVNENNKFMISNDNGSLYEQKPSGCWRETPLDYGLEEIKQLISSSTSSCNNILFDEEKVIYY